MAILAVLAYHETPPSSWFFPIATLGHHGVPLFFGLSGFLITGLIADELRRTNALDLRSFYIRRVFRILPPVLAYLLVTAVLSAAAWLPSVSSIDLVSSGAFFRNYLPTRMAPHSVTGHLWSLSVEEHFYLLWPVTLAALGTRRGLSAAVCCALFIAAWRVGDQHWQILSRWLSDVDPTQRTDRCADGLMWGAALALASREERLRSIFDARGWASVQLPLALAYGAVIALAPKGSKLLEALVVPALLWSTARWPNTLFGRVLECPLFVLVGRLSYSVYVWHALFLAGRYAAEPAWRAFPLGVVWTVIAAGASFLLIEEPARRFGRALARRVQAVPKVQPRPSTLG